LDLHEIGVQKLARHRVHRVLAQEHGELLATVDAELDDRILTQLALEDVAEPLGRHRQSDRGQLLAVSNRGDLPLLTQPTGGGLAGVVANLCVELDDLHDGLRKFFQTKSELTESLLWILRIASPKRRAMEICLILPDAAASGESGMLLVNTTSARGESMI